MRKHCSPSPLMITAFVTLLFLSGCGMFRSGIDNEVDRPYRPLTNAEWLIACKTLDSLLIDEGENITQYTRKINLYPLIIEGFYKPSPPDSGQKSSGSGIRYTFLLSRMTLKYYSSDWKYPDIDTAKAKVSAP